MFNSQLIKAVHVLTGGIVNFTTGSTSVLNTEYYWKRNQEKRFGYFQWLDSQNDTGIISFTSTGILCTYLLTTLSLLPMVIHGRTRKNMNNVSKNGDNPGQSFTISCVQQLRCPSNLEDLSSLQKKADFTRTQLSLMRLIQKQWSKWRNGTINIRVLSRSFDLYLIIITSTNSLR